MPIIIKKGQCTKFNGKKIIVIIEIFWYFSVRQTHFAQSAHMWLQKLTDVFSNNYEKCTLKLTEIENRNSYFIK